jgi:Uma2 family endonuclease
MTTLTGKLYTVEEYLALSTNKQYELVEGELVEMGQPGYRHGVISSKLFRKLADFVDNQNLGIVLITTGFRLAERTVRAPDIMFIQKERVTPITDGPVDVIPDIAIEVISPSDDWSKIIEKVREYQRVNVKLIWLIDPNLKAVHIFHPQDNLPTLNDQEINGENILPNFRLSINDLF